MERYAYLPMMATEKGEAAEALSEPGNSLPNLADVGLLASFAAREPYAGEDGGMFSGTYPTPNPSYGVLNDDISQQQVPWERGHSDVAMHTSGDSDASTASTAGERVGYHFSFWMDTTSSHGTPMMTPDINGSPAMYDSPASYSSSPMFVAEGGVFPGEGEGAVGAVGGASPFRVPPSLLMRDMQSGALDSGAHNILYDDPHLMPVLNALPQHLGGRPGGKEASKQRLLNFLYTNPSLAPSKRRPKSLIRSASASPLQHAFSTLVVGSPEPEGTGDLDSGATAATDGEDGMPGIFACTHPGCGRSFNRIQNLRSHSRCHLNVAPHHCDTCNCAFKRLTDLQRHIRTVHSTADDKPWACHGCGKRFGRSDAVKRHVSSKSLKFGCPVLLPLNLALAEAAGKGGMGDEAGDAPSVPVDAALQPLDAPSSSSLPTEVGGKAFAPQRRHGKPKIGNASSDNDGPDPAPILAAHGSMPDYLATSYAAHYLPPL